MQGQQSRVQPSMVELWLSHVVGDHGNFHDRPSLHIDDIDAATEPSVGD
jgi:hypothetical protein